MAKAPRKSPVRTKKPNETEFKDKVLSETLERVDRFGSYAAEKVDSLSGVSKEILRAVERCLGDGVGKAYKPLAIYLEGKAKVAVEANRIVQIAEAEAKAELIRTETSGRQALLDAELLEELARRTKTRFVNQELFRQANLEAILEESIQIAETEHHETPPESIDDSWMWKFINHAQDVSEQELRTIWARLLTSKGAGKNVRPITLDKLRLFDKRLATSFGRISLFCCLYTFVPADSWDNEKTIKELADIGVLEPVYSQGLDSEEFSILEGESSPELVHLPYKYRIYKMTRVGEQIFDVIYPELSNYYNILLRGEELALRKRIVELASKEECIKHLTKIVVCFALQNQLKSVIFSSTNTNKNRFDSENIEIKVLPDGVRDARCLRVKKIYDEIIFEDIMEFLRRIPLE